MTTACGAWAGSSVCGSVDGVRLYPGGRRCAEHTPQPVTPAPDPLFTYAALRELHEWRSASDRFVAEHRARRGVA